MRLIFVIGLALISCDSKKEPTSSPAEPQKKSAHPWDWTPHDPALVAGKKVYLDECAGCHNEGEEGAPALTNSKQWTKRKAKGFTILLNHAINGYDGSDGEMPARGGTPSLTDEQVTNAVNFMLTVAEPERSGDSP